MTAVSKFPDIDRYHALTRRAFLQALVDFTLITILLSVINALVFRQDPGWLSRNPTPFLLVPALLGVRHGCISGLVAGTAIAGLIVLARQLLTDLPVQDHRLVLSSLPLCGLIIGQCSGFLRRDTQKREVAHQDLAGENRNLRAERQLLFLAKQDLQQRLGLYGANAASLEQDIEELARCDSSSAPEALLATLQRLTKVRSAAVYELTNPRAIELTRQAAIGPASCYPEILAGTAHHLINESVKRRCFLAQEGLLHPTPSRTPGFLLASPIIDSNGAVQYLVVVHDLPFTEISRRNFSTIKSICDWFAAFIINPVDTPSQHKAVSQTDFFTAIETAITTHTEHALPSTLIRLPFNGTPTGSMTGAFSEFLETLPGPALLTSAIENGQSSLLLLFPAKAGREFAAAFDQALQNFAQRLGVPVPATPHIQYTHPDSSPQQLWGELLATA